MTELAAEARDAFNSYLSALGEQRFDAAAAALQRLRDALERMTTATPTDS
jgi:hypothetical protein